MLVFASGTFILLHIVAFFNKTAQYNIIMADVIWAFVILVVRTFANEFSSFLHKFFKKGRRIAVVGNTDGSLHIAEKFQRKGKHFFYGQINFGEDDFTTTSSFYPYIDFAKKNRINEVYMPASAANPLMLNTMVEEAEKYCIRVNFIAADETTENPGYRIHYISGLPVLKKYNEPLIRLRNQSIKRAFDVIISGCVMLFILSWLVPLIGLIIKLESKGPVFFKQERSGRDNNSFGCLKFRSMRVNKQSDTMQASKNDTRITRFGAFLRKTSIDELPQFINVFKGEMSIVGPRPHMLRHTEEYNELVKHYMVRLYLRPGVTGWAQANGYRGETRELSLMKKRVEYDIWYMENWSLLLDIKILWLTFITVLKGHENAY